MVNWEKIACVCTIVSYNICAVTTTNTNVGGMGVKVVWGSTFAFVTLTIACIAAFLIFHRRMDMPTVGSVFLIIILFVDGMAMLGTGGIAYNDGHRHAFSLFLFSGALAVTGGAFFIVDLAQ